MADAPSSMTALVNLGRSDAAQLAGELPFIPARITAGWDEDSQTTTLRFDYGDVQIHADVSDQAVSYHFHSGGASDSSTPPWGFDVSRAVAPWASFLTADVHRLMPGLIELTRDAAARNVYWGDDAYLGGDEPWGRNTDVVEVLVGAPQSTDPWAGVGVVSISHAPGTDHRMSLAWTAVLGADAQIISYVWTDPATGDVRAESVNDVNWTAVGVSDAGAAAWLSSEYRTHLLFDDVQGSLMEACVRRLGGVKSRTFLGDGAAGGS